MWSCRSKDLEGQGKAHVRPSVDEVLGFESREGLEDFRLGSSLASRLFQCPDR